MATRRERVILELEDKFSAGMLRAAASAKAADEAFDGLGDSSNRSSEGIDRTGKSSSRASKDIDRFSGRLTLLRDVSLTLGPALLPIGAVAVPAVTALAAQFGAAAVAGGTALAAFQGVGTALEAVNKAALEPTTENLQAARAALAGLSPEAREFVKQLQDMRPALMELRDSAAAGLFPGLSAALDDLTGSFDTVESILLRVGAASGDLAEDFAEGIAGPRGQEFLAFIGNEVPGALTELGQVVGNLAAGMGELWMAFTPLNRSASDWMVDASRSFDDWAQGLSETEGFQEFVAYLRDNGPRVADALGSIGNAVLQVAEAMAPLGGPALEALTAFADVVAFIANSPIGPPLAAAAASMVLISRSMQAMNAVKASTMFQAMTTGADGASRSMSKLGRAVTTATGAAVGLEVMRAAIEGLESAMDKTLPTTQELVGNLLDLESGTAGRLTGDFDSVAESLARVELASDGMTGKLTSIAGFADKYGGGGLLGLAFDSPAQKAEDARQEIEALDAALADIAATGGAGQAQNAFRALAESQGLTAEQTDQLLGMLPQYRDALAGIENQGRLTGDGLEDGFERGRTAAERFMGAVTRLNNLLEGRAELRDYEAALDDFTKGLKDNGRSFDINTEKGRLNQANLDNIAGTLGRVVDQMKRSERQEVLKKARADIRDLHDAGKLSEEQMKFLLGEINKLDKASAKPKVDVDTAGAFGAIAGVAGALAGLDGRTATVHIKAQRSALAGAALGAGGFAAGGAVHGPGTGTSDSVPAWLSNGEHVWTAREVANAGGHAAIEALRSQYRFANGGAVDSRAMAAAPAVSVAAPNVSVGGARVQVLLGAQELRAVIRQEINDADDWRGGLR